MGIENRNYIELDKYLEITRRPLVESLSFTRMVEVLQEANKIGVDIHCNFNGCDFYSTNFSVDEAYIKFYDMSKEEQEYYENNRYKIIIELITDSKFYVPNDVYHDYVLWVVANSSFCRFLRSVRYVIKNLDDAITKNVKDEYIAKFRTFDDISKYYAKDIIEQFIDERYKDIILELLELKDFQK